MNNNLTIKGSHYRGCDNRTYYVVSLIGEGYDIFLCDESSEHYGEWRNFSTDVGNYRNLAEARAVAKEWREKYKAFVQAQDADGIIRNPNFGKFVMNSCLAAKTTH